MVFPYMNYQYKLTHFKGDMGHGVASDVVSLLVLMVVSGLFGQPPYQSLCIGQWITTFHDEVVVPWQEGQWHVLWLWVCTIHKFTTRLLPPPSIFCGNCSRSHKKSTQSSTSPPPHHPKLTLITHCHFGNDHGAPAIHRQHHMIPHYQAIASTPILAKLFENLRR